MVMMTTNNNKKMSRIIATTILLLFCTTAKVFADSVAEDPLEREMLVIAGKLRCAVCQNQPVSESHSGLAKDMRQIIREQLEQGRSEEEIIGYFVDRYGDYVLLKPRKAGIGLPLWVFPPVILLLVGSFAWMVLRRRPQDIPAASTPELDEEDRERIRRARDQDKDGEDS
jgi:cytochrome c-type biogenesis protein CcmH